MEGKNKPNYRLFLIMAMSTSILLVSPVAALALIGYIADNIFHTAPMYLIVGIIIGFVSGVSNVFRMMRMIQRRKSQKNKSSF